MSKINIKHLEKLAKLDLTPDEERSLESNLTKLVGRFAELESLEVGSSVESKSYSLEKAKSNTCAQKQGLREDRVVGKTLSIEKVLEQSPNRLGDAFGVPRVL